MPIKIERRLGLTWKLIAHILWIVIALGTIFTWHAIKKEKALLVDELRLRHTAQVKYWIQNNLLSLISPDPKDPENLDNLVDVLGELKNSSEVAYVILYDAEGRQIVASGSDPHLRLAGEKVRPTPTPRDAHFEQIVTPEGEFYELAVPIRLPERQGGLLSTVTELLPTQPQLSVQPETLGVVHLGILGENIGAKMRSIRNETIGLAAVVVTFALVLTYAFTQRSTRPIKRVAEQAAAIAHGDFSQTERLLNIRSADEVGDLARNFYEMSVRLKQSREQLERFNRELEEKVQERTRDLEIANRQLGEANKRLREVDELKSNFLSTVSHELRTPLTSIKAFAEILLDNRGEDLETQIRFLNIINDESERLSRLIGDLLDLSKIESGVMKWKFEALDIRETVRKSLEAISSLAAKKNIMIRTDFPETCPSVEGDPDRLVQVVTNLLSNAVKFTDEGGHIDVGGKSTADGLRVFVRDDGIGIPPEHLGKVFEKFLQVDTAAARQRGGGTGLGLAICKEIVEYHKGKVWLESELGKGSTFFFTIPFAGPPPASAVESGTHRIPLTEDRAATAGAEEGTMDRARPRKVLVVDDEPHIREFLRYELLKEGFEVVEAANGEETIDLARRAQPDLITLDILMPGIDGFDILSILRHDERTSHIPVMMLSIVDDKEKGLRLGAVDYLVKPIQRKEFIDTLKKVLAETKSAGGQMDA